MNDAKRIQEVLSELSENMILVNEGIENPDSGIDVELEFDILKEKLIATSEELESLRIR